MGKRLTVLLTCLLAASVWSGAASAGDVSTTVLGLLSDEADSTFAEEFSGYLREAVKARESLGHTGKDQTLEQVAMAFGCLDSLDPMCLQEIGEGLETTLLVHGKVEASFQDFEVTVTLFDVVKGKVVKSTSSTIAGDKQGSIYLQDASDRIIAELLDEEPRTTIIVQSNKSGATILLDGEEVGNTGADPVWLRDVEPGEHELSVEKDGYETFTKEFEIKKGGRLDIDAPLYKVGEKPAGGGVSPVKGPKVKPDKGKVMLWSGVGVGIVGLGLIGAGVGMTAMVSGANDDLSSARQVTLSGQDVCSCFNESLPTAECFGSPAWPSDVSRSNVKDACSKGKTGQAAQFVFYSVGAAAAAAGIALIITSLVKKKGKKAAVEEDDEDEEEYEDEVEYEDEEEEASIHIIPSITPDGGFISVVGRF